MAVLFVQHLVINNSENWPIQIKELPKWVEKFAVTKLTNGFKVLPKLRNFTQSGHTGSNIILNDT